MSPTHPTCRRCGRKFVSDSRLANHIEVVHNVKRCESCKRFIGKNGNHACEAPAVKKAYSCFANNCSYSSNKKGNMMRHWRTNHSEEGKETIKRIAASAEKEERRLSGQKKAEKKERKRRIASEKSSSSAHSAARASQKKLQRQRSFGLQPSIASDESSDARECLACNRFVVGGDSAMRSHIEAAHGPAGKKPLFKHGQSAFSRAISSYRRDYEPLEVLDPAGLFLDDNSEDLLRYELLLRKKMMVQFAACVTLKQFVEGGTERIRQVKSFGFRRRPIFTSDLNYIRSMLKQVQKEMHLRFGDYDGEEGSGWTLEFINRIDINIFDIHSSFSGRSGANQTFKEVRSYLKKNFHIVSAFEDVPSPKNDCFYSAVLQYFHGMNDRNDRSLAARRTCLQKLKKKGEEIGLKRTCGSPVSAFNTGKFEEDNSHLSIKVNVFVKTGEGEENGRMGIVPFSISARKARHTINLLLLNEGLSEPHYVLIRDLGKVLSISNNEELSKEEKKMKLKAGYPCEKCLFIFTSKSARDNHTRLCILNEDAPQQIVVSAPGKKAAFSAYDRTIKRPFFGVVDFETIETDPSSSSRSSTPSILIQKELLPVSFSLIFVDRDANIVFERHEKSRHHCSELFMQALDDAERHLESLLKWNEPHNLHPDVVARMKKRAKKCFLCKGPFALSYKEELEFLRKSASSGASIKEEAEKEENENEGPSTRRTRGEIRCLDHDHQTGEPVSLEIKICDIKRT